MQQTPETPGPDPRGSWEDGFKAGVQRTLRKHFHPSFVQGTCFPTGHMCVTSTSSETTYPISVCTRCGVTVIHGAPGPDESERLYRRFGRKAAERPVVEAG